MTRWDRAELANVVDYSIHFLEPINLLIAHMRYIGNDYEGDMAQIGKSEATKKWWKVSRVEFLLIIFDSRFKPYIRKWI
jgi:L-rhamnose mutarotase